MSTTDTRAIHDPEQALALAGGRPELRDQTLIRILDWLDDPDAGGLLRAVGRYGQETAACYEAAHRGCGLARQAAMPTLATLLRQLADALDAADLARAETLGRQLPAAITDLEHVLGTAGPAGRTAH